MSIFSTNFTEYIANKFNLDTNEVSEALREASNLPEVNAAKIAKKTIPKESKTTTKTKSKTPETEESHTCCRIKKGQKTPCGKAAKKTIIVKGKTLYYCGGDKSGCYPAALKANAVQELNDESTKLIKPTASKGGAPKIKVGNLGDRKAIADTKTESLLKNITPKPKLTFITKSANTKAHGVVWYDVDSRYLINRATSNIYGVLGRDNETIEKLSDEQVRQIEASGHIIEEFVVETKKKNEPEATVESENSDEVEPKSMSDDDEDVSGKELSDEESDNETSSEEDEE